MSKTPETDRLLTQIYDRDGSVGPHNAPELLIVKLRELEIELAETNRIAFVARNEIARLTGQTNYACECGGTKLAEAERDSHAKFLDDIGRLFGTAALTREDGSVSDTPIFRKLPDLVAAAVADSRRWNAIVSLGLLKDPTNEFGRTVAEVNATVDAEIAKLEKEEHHG